MKRLLVIASNIALILASHALASDLPAMTDKVAREFRVYQKKPAFKAFAMNKTGAYGYGYDAVSSDAADWLALKGCNANRGKQPTRVLRASPCEIVDRVER